MMTLGRVPLSCPRDHTRLKREANRSLTCALGHHYPVIDGIPVLLCDDVPQTTPWAAASIARARNPRGAADPRSPDLFLESLGINEAEKDLAVALFRNGKNKIDPVVSVIIAATSGYTCKWLIGNLDTYPIPELRLPPGNGKLLLDVGCNWGRWSLAAARKGYRVVGVDPSLGAVMAARRVTRQLAAEIEYIVADARYLPFEEASFDTVFSYSVIQHFSKADAVRTIAEIGRTLKPSGSCLIQMAQVFGIRSLYHQLRRGFRQPHGFEVRYWTVAELLKVFQQRIGPADISADCYFGLGLQACHKDLVPYFLGWIITASEGLRRLSSKLHCLTYFADSLYVSANKQDSEARYQVCEEGQGGCVHASLRA